MKPSRHSYKPFEELNLKALLKHKRYRLPSYTSEKPVCRIDLPEIEDEQELFEAAMSDVQPIAPHNRLERSPENVNGKKTTAMESDAESEGLKKLRALVENGKGFVVSDTPEYIEGIGYEVNPEVTKRLHRGDFSIQSYVDLHGLNVHDAKEVFESFMNDAVKNGKRAVAVVHGRGLSSPVEPVLKTKVQQWLTTGPLRKWVMAFTSAMSCDGGAGATYVLLRNRPLTKKYRKRKTRKPKPEM